MNIVFIGESFYYLFLNIIFHYFKYSFSISAGNDAWKKSILKHQKLDTTFTYLNVCSMHFENFEILPNKRLRSGAIPTIFS